jgi:hypothetical protein
MVIRLVACDLDPESDTACAKILANLQSGKELFPFTPAKSLSGAGVDKARRF